MWVFALVVEVENLFAVQQKLTSKAKSLGTEDTTHFCVVARSTAFTWATAQKWGTPEKSKK